MKAKNLGLVASALLFILCPANGTTFRWATSSQRIYVTGPGTATLTDIKNALPGAPLTLVNPSNQVWYLGVNLSVEAGARLNLYGPASGGDVAELRLKSDNSALSNAIVELRVDWGSLDIRHTKVTSWDNAANAPDTETDTYRRAYIRARSTLDPDGVTAHESRMDISDSEICYLGSNNTEAYGLTWKVVDSTAVNIPAGSTQTLFDVVHVYGDILNSHIHHNFFGVYTFGHYGGHWATNEVDHNIRYGFDPHDDSDYLVIENNNVHHNGWHGIIASKRCDHGVMRNNVSWSNGLDRVDPHGHGLMLHRSSNDWLVEGNQSYGNADTGISIFGCDRTLIRHNLCLSNANAGIRLNVGSANNWIEANEIGGMHRYGLYLFEGDDPPEPDEDGGVGGVRCYGNTFTNNVVRDCTSDYIKVNGADSNAFFANVFVGSNPTLRFERGSNNLVCGNLLPTNALAKLVGTATNLNSTTFKQAARLSVQLDRYSTATFTDDEGAIFEFVQNDMGTEVDHHTGSIATATAAQLGTGANAVLRRNFFVIPGWRDVLVTPTLWEVNGTQNKQWTSQASSATANILYAVGDLAPNNSYAILKNGAPLSFVVSDSSGRINFADTTGTTGAVQYAIAPTNQPPPEGVVAVVASDASASERDLNAGTFTISRNGSVTAALNVKYIVGGKAVNGSDYVPLPGAVLIPGGADSATVVVSPIDDSRHERAESVRLTLAPDPAYSVNLLTNSATFKIRDNDPRSFSLGAALFPPYPGQTNTTLALSWKAAKGRSYQLQFKSGWNATWINLGSILTTSNDYVTASDVIGSEPQRYYRAVLLP